MKKFSTTSESTRKATVNKNVKTVHDVPLMPETRAARRLHHSAEAICLELPHQSYHQFNQSIIPSCGDGVFSDERPSVKMKLYNIWKNKLQAQGECTNTRDGESKEEFAPIKTQSFFYSGTKWKDFRPEITSGTGTENI